VIFGNIKKRIKKIVLNNFVLKKLRVKNVRVKNMVPAYNSSREDFWANFVQFWRKNCQIWPKIAKKLLDSSAQKNPELYVPHCTDFCGKFVELTVSSRNCQCPPPAK